MHYLFTFVSYILRHVSPMFSSFYQFTHITFGPLYVIINISLYFLLVNFQTLVFFNHWYFSK